MLYRNSSDLKLNAALNQSVSLTLIAFVFRVIVGNDCKLAECLEFINDDSRFLGFALSGRILVIAKPTQHVVDGVKASRFGGRLPFGVLGACLSRNGAVRYTRAKDIPLIPERRAKLRHRKRLLSGKTLTVQGVYLRDCTIVNQSTAGARIRLARAAALPQQFLLFDDRSSVLFVATIVWRQANEAGCRIERASARDHARIAKAMGLPYYAMK